MNKRRRHRAKHRRAQHAAWARWERTMRHAIAGEFFLIPGTHARVQRFLALVRE